MMVSIALMEQHIKQKKGKKVEDEMKTEALIKL